MCGEVQEPQTCPNLQSTGRGQQASRTWSREPSTFGLRRWIWQRNQSEIWNHCYPLTNLSARESSVSLTFAIVTSSRVVRCVCCWDDI
jgi:hypothetical protein